MSHFLFGAATSAYQIEGATSEDGRGLSIWDVFARKPGAIADGSTGDVACDHYHRYSEDIALMRWLGLQAYRFSVAWPRILPEGRGRINPKGLAFYDRLVDALLEAGITPFLTLYHWDLPWALEEQGGWRSRETAHAFAEYAEIVGRALGDRVPSFATLNEPWCSAFLGHWTGEHAPGEKNLEAALKAAHHLLLGHGLAVEALRAAGVKEVGLVLNFAPVYGEDEEAVKRADIYHNRFFLDPVLGRGYPESPFLNPPPMPIQEGDLEIIARPIDFLGVNYYSRARVARGEGVYPVRYLPPENPVTDMGWEVYPQGLYDLLKRLARETSMPLYITENGAAYPDRWQGEEVVEDPEQVAYLRDHLEAALRAEAEGVDLRGYFVWSLLDNFEWAFGYTKRFGIVYVDYPTQRRIPKRSAHWYREWIKAQLVSR
jgi:beta-glucosidase